MKGDFTRFTHKPQKHYKSVLKQQGRVDLDADWNEQASIQAYLDEEESKDTIGPTGIPNRLGGFDIFDFNFVDGDPSKGVDFSIGPGRIYVDGILCDLESRDDGTTDIAEDENALPSYLNQPDYPTPEQVIPADGRKDLVYLDVWKRHITAAEDSELREVALGCPDTTTRMKTVWQVKVLQDVESEDPCEVPKWWELTEPEPGRLSVLLSSSQSEERPCATNPEGGYRGRENRLYRVEIHNGGWIVESGLETASQPTFKWSRDNGAVVYPIQELDKSNARKVKIKRLGKDQFLALHKGDWVEVLDDARELAGKPGIMAEVVEEIDEDQLIVTLSKNVQDIDVEAGHAKLCRWDQMKDAISITPFVPMDLEAGVQVLFSEGRFKTGDYWVFTARSNGDVELLEDEPPMGIEHHYCILALISWQTDGSGGLKADVLDCRRTFPSLTDLTCLYYIGGDGQEAMPGEEIKQPLQVGVSNGRQPLNGPSVAGMKVEFKIFPEPGMSADGKYGLLSMNSGEYPATYEKVVVPIGEDGIAKCYWKLGTISLSQQVEARLIDACGNPVHLPVRFSANLSIASEVAYDRPRCVHMSDENAIKSVRDALNILCDNFGLYYVGGDGQEAMPGHQLKRPFQVRAANGQWPKAEIKVRFKIDVGDGSFVPVTSQVILDSGKTLETLTGPDGIAECKFKLGSANYHQITAQMQDASDQPIDLPVRFSANASIASQIGYTPSTLCNALGEVDNVEDAINKLCQLPRGGGCAVTVGEGGQYAHLDEAIDKLLEKQTDICICMLPGDHELPEGLNVPPSELPVNIRIVGCGSGVRIRFHEKPLLMKYLASVTLKDLEIDIGTLSKDALVFEGCRDVRVESCHLEGRVPADQEEVSDRIIMENVDNAITLSRNRIILLMNGINIRTANSDELRYYICKEITITELGTYGIRSSVATGTTTWTADNFAGFYYDIDNNIKTEELTATVTGGNRLSGNQPYGIKYLTTAQNKAFKFEDWGTFRIMGFMGEPYFAGYCDKKPVVGGEEIDPQLYKESTDRNLLIDEQLLKVLMDDDTEETVTSGTPLKMQEGYELSIKSIDIDGNKVYLELSKDGDVVDSKVVSPSKDGATMADKTYYYKKDIGDTKGIVIIGVHFKNAFRGGDTNLATVDGVFQVSDTPSSVEVDIEYDKMTITSVDANAGTITMENKDNAITLSRNKDTVLMSGINIKTADKDTLRYYLYKLITEPGNYEVRGTVATGDFTWDPQNFAGFYYDINDDIGTETLDTTITGDKKLSGDLPYGIKYASKAPQNRAFKFEDWGWYNSIGFLGENYFAGYSDKRPAVDGEEIDPHLYKESTDRNLLIDEQLLRVLMDDDTEKTVTSGSPLQMQEGYELAIKSIDIDGNKVSVELSKDGQVVSKKVVQPSKDGATMADKTYYYRKDIGDTKDIVIIGVHFKNAFRGGDTILATVDGVFQVSDTPSRVEVDTPYDKMTITQPAVKPPSRGILLSISGSDSICLEKNTFDIYEDIEIDRVPKIFDRDVAPELYQLFLKADIKNFDASANALAKRLALLNDEERANLSKRLKGSLDARISDIMPKEVASYRLFLESVSRKKAEPISIVQSLKSMHKTLRRAITATAVAIGDGNANTALRNNTICGLVALYGIPAEKELNYEDVADRIEQIKKMKFSGPGKVLFIQNNQLTRIAIGEYMVGRIRDVLDNEGTEIAGVYKSGFISDNEIELGNNQILAKHLAICSNFFEETKTDYAGMAISGSAVYVGNAADSGIKLFAISRNLDKDAGNLIIDIV